MPFIFVHLRQFSQRHAITHRNRDDTPQNSSCWSGIGPSIVTSVDRIGAVEHKIFYSRFPGCFHRQPQRSKCRCKSGSPHLEYLHNSMHPVPSSGPASAPDSLPMTRRSATGKPVTSSTLSPHRFIHGSIKLVPGLNNALSVRPAHSSTDGMAEYRRRLVPVWLVISPIRIPLQRRKIFPLATHQCQVKNSGNVAAQCIRFRHFVRGRLLGAARRQFARDEIEIKIGHRFRRQCPHPSVERQRNVSPLPFG